MKTIAAFVLVSFTSSLAAPAVRAEMDSTAAATATQGAKMALSDLWFAWVKQGGSSSVKPDTSFARNFFLKQGATAQQADVLTANAQAAGHLSSPMASSTNSITGWLKSKMGIKPAAPAASAAAPQSTGIVDKVKSWFGFGSSSSAASDTASTNSLSAAQAGPRPGWGDNVHEGLNKAGDAVHNVAQKAKGVFHDIGGGVTTAVLTVGDKVDPRAFYSIPMSETSAVKITGGSSYTVRFSNKGLTNQQVSSDIRLVDAIKSNEATGQIGKLETQFGPAEATTGPIGSLIGKFKGALSSFKAKITGKPSINAAENSELAKYNVQGNLLEQAQGLNQVQSAIQVRINKLQTDAARLGRPEPTEEIANLRRTYDTVEAQKKDVIDKIQQVDRGGLGNTLNAGVKWALYSVGIQASINVIKQVMSGEKVDFKQAFNFMGQPSFWAGTAGGFVGSLVLSNLASALIPGGGIFMKILPGFLGASLGYEVGAGFFGGGSGDWLGTIGQTLASAGAYALAYSFLGGAAAPGLALIAAGIAGGALFNFLYSKLRGKHGAQSADNGVPPPDLGAPLPDPQANGGAGAPPAGGSGGTHASPVGAGNLVSLESTMQQAYTDYINYLKDQKVTDARAAFDRYTNAKNQLEAAKGAASASNTVNSAH